MVVHYVDVVYLTDGDSDRGESEDESETESERGKNGKTDSTAAATSSELTLWCTLGLLVGGAIQVPQLQLQLYGCTVPSLATDSQLNCLPLMWQNCC